MSLDATRQKLQWIARQLRQKHRWMEDHGPTSKRPWPEHEVSNKREDIDMLEAIAADYERVEARYLEREDAA